MRVISTCTPVCFWYSVVIARHQFSSTPQYMISVPSALARAPKHARHASSTTAARRAVHAPAKARRWDDDAVMACFPGRFALLAEADAWPPRHGKPARAALRLR